MLNSVKIHSCHFMSSEFLENLEFGQRIDLGARLPAIWPCCCPCRAWEVSPGADFPEKDDLYNEINTNGGVHKWWYPNRWMVYMEEKHEKPSILLDDLGVLPFQETSKHDEISMDKVEIQKKDLWFQPAAADLWIGGHQDSNLRIPTGPSFPGTPELVWRDAYRRSANSWLWKWWHHWNQGISMDFLQLEPSL